MAPKNNQINTTFCEFIRKKIPGNLSVVEEIAEILEINYDAAYRRLNGKVDFSLEEAVKIFKKYDFSFNELFNVGEIGSYVVQESNALKSINDFNVLLDNTYRDLKLLCKKEDASILFATREIPMFYFFDNPILIKLHFYIWYYLSDFETSTTKINFKDFVISDIAVEKTMKIRAIYNQINLTEIWSFGALNNILKQILYFYKIRQITFNDANIIFSALTNELKNLEKYISTNNHSDRKFELYNNDIIMNNNVMISNYKGRKKTIYQFTFLKFFTITDSKACNEQEEYLLNQLKYCTNVSKASVKVQTAFFNHKYDKIKQVLDVITNEEERPVFL